MPVTPPDAQEPDTPDALQMRLAEVKSRVAAAAFTSGRSPESVRLLAVSKTFGAPIVAQAARLGQTCFGENYVQEGVAKIQALSQQSHLPKLEWHFIGPIQSNKTRLIAEHFDWVQSLERLSVAQRLSNQRPPNLPDLQVLIQVNISAEPSKSGVTVQEALDLAGAVANLPRLCLRGIMAIPQAGMSDQAQQACFGQMQQLWQTLKQQFARVDTLSMGMSADFEQAIAAGSTMVRVGSAIFGERT